MFRLFFLPLLLTLGLGGVAAQAEVRVLTSIKPLQLIAAAVQDGLGEPDVLLPPGASAHHYSLRPSDVRRIGEARLLYWVGPDLENFLTPVLRTRNQPSVAVQALPGMSLRHFGDDDGHDDHDHDHRPGSLDAHLWLLPANARVIAARMASDLAAADPDNAERYQTNLHAFEQRLDGLDERLRASLGPSRGKPYFVFHEAYNYFEAAYGLQHVGVFSIGGEVQPGARHVAAMRQRLQLAGPSCIFNEPPLRPRLAETLGSGLPVRLAELDALGADLPVNAQGYERLLENLGKQLSSCLEAL